MSDIEIVKVDNGSRNYPGSFSNFETKTIKEYIEGNVLHLFSGSSLIGNVRVDFSHENATHHEDAFEFLIKNKEHFDTAIIDAPYNQKFAQEYAKISGVDSSKQFIIFADSKKTTELFKLINQKGIKRIIIKSWNYYVPKNYVIKKCFICYAGGYRKPTFLMILDRI